MKNNLLLIFLILSSTLMYTQQIENVRFEQDGKLINIYYDLLQATVERTSKIDVYCSRDGGITWGTALKCVTGSVGEKQSAGSGKKIVWDVLCENENLTGNILFEVRAFQKLLTGTYTDERDKQEYKWVKIGSQVWMAENLNYNADSGNWAYLNNPSNSLTYGLLYTWETAVKVCPLGWHLPSDRDWTVLTDYLGGKEIAGSKLKEVGPTHWYSPNEGATNESGFTALPGGCCYSFGSFDECRIYGKWWTSSECSSSSAWYWSLHWNSSRVHSLKGLKNSGYSVRCVNDKD